MAIKIAIPDKEYFRPLVGNHSFLVQAEEIDITFLPEDDIPELLDKGFADLALLNPLNYGKLLLNEEYDIIPTKCLSGVSFSELEKIYFAENLTGISSVGINEKSSFLEIISKIILQEKYNFETQFNPTKGSLQEALLLFDAVLTSQKIPGKINSLDLTEEWFDTFEFELPLGFWVAKKSDNLEKFTDLTHKIAQENLADFVPLWEEIQNSSTNYEREGRIKYQFDSDTEAAIDQILELLYQLGYLDEMTDSKISLN